MPIKIEITVKETPTGLGTFTMDMNFVTQPTNPTKRELEMVSVIGKRHKEMLMLMGRHAKSAEIVERNGPADA